jgi:hypothetical protein
MSTIPALTLEQITQQGIDPALALLPPAMDSPEARCLLLAIGAQESGFRDRRQIIQVKRGGKLVAVAEGPAKSFWQGERGGGMVRGVRLHPATAKYARRLYAGHQHLECDRARRRPGRRPGPPAAVCGSVQAAGAGA